MIKGQNDKQRSTKHNTEKLKIEQHMSSLFFIVNFLFTCSNIPSAPAYEVYISKLIRNSRACASYQNQVL
jgi:hypothetical protein